MMAWISALCKNPSAKLKINGSLSGSVSITNGTRQGCLLSPLLFILLLKPFIRRVKAERTIQGFKVANREFKVAAYLLFFLTNPHTLIPTLLKEFSLYGYISNLKINYTKSKVMKITIPGDSIKSIQDNSPFKWEASALKYLGVWLTPRLYLIYKRNFLPLLKTNREKLTSTVPEKLLLVYLRSHLQNAYPEFFIYFEPYQ